ncbi:Hypothetical predicted protein [Olea europaea subsp. europaea]|uniref:Uncharacterized protein n=1 Tax=Olea europaea subsp. europaea TaxID=158383 RepID=A0A8S0SAA2_OLEEU|nr:Hypothetical predicted protein [Olea europaea subsp. europaea]
MSVWVNACPGFCAGPPPNNRSNVHMMLFQGRTAARARHTASHGGRARYAIHRQFGAVPRPSSAIFKWPARRVVGPQFHEATLASGTDDGSDAGDGHDDESGAGVEDVDTSASDGHQTPKGNGDDGSKLDDSGESGHEPSSETGVVAPSTSGVQGTGGGATLTREDVDGMLYDQRILFKMRLRTVKLEIMQHVPRSSPD